MKLYSNPFSPNCRKVFGVIDYGGLELETETVDLRKGAQKTPDFLSLNPNGKVPVLVDGDSKLWESNAIACHLAGKGDSALWPRSDQRYDIMRWLFWEANHWSKAIGAVVFQKVFRADNPDQAIIDQGIADFRTHAAVLDGHLKSRQHLSGDGLTVSDFVLGVWLGYAPAVGLPLADFANVDKWYQALTKLPAWKRMPPPQR